MSLKTVIYISVILILSNSISARSFRVAQLPNGSVGSCQTCHVSPGGGGERNLFGKLVEKRFLTSPTGNVIWGPELASLDADGDGFTNGDELQDPMGSWNSSFANPGILSAVSQPWNQNDIPLVALTVSFFDMTPHSGQTLFIRVIDKATLKEVTRNTETISANFDLILDFALVPGNNYFVDFFADHNGNGIYDIPPIDHSWRLEINAAASNNNLIFNHNTNFTNIEWESTFDLNFISMTPHLNQLLEIVIIKSQSGEEIDRKRIETISSANFSQRFYGLVEGIEYKAQFFADHNGNGIYDSPPTDHSWEINFTYNEGLSIDFTHNTSFTNLDWKYLSTLNLVNMLPHLGQLFEMRLVNTTDNLEVTKLSLDELLVANSVAYLPGIEIGKNYNIDFYADHNGNKTYDAPPTDHAWRISFTAEGNFIQNFEHNTNFTDIQWPSATSVNSLELPTFFNLEQNYPNPFNPTTTIEFSLPNNENVSIDVYDVLGNKIAEILNEYKSAGNYKVNFDASNLTSGIYLYRLTSGSYIQTNKMILLK